MNPNDLSSALVRKEIANRAGVLRSDVGKLRYKMVRRRRNVRGLHKVVASHS